MVKIGNIEINGLLALAPMAGVTDIAFREVCRSAGAAYTCTEMVSAKARSREKSTPVGMCEFALLASIATPIVLRGSIALVNFRRY